MRLTTPVSLSITHAHRHTQMNTLFHPHPFYGSVLYMIPENTNVAFQKTSICSSTMKSKLCNRTQKTPLCQTLENLSTTHPQPITKSFKYNPCPQGKILWFLSLANMHSFDKFLDGKHYMERLWPYLLPGTLPSVWLFPTTCCILDRSMCST